MFQQAGLTETLNGIPWFLELKPEQIERLARIGLLRELKAGETLYCEGMQQDSIYILLEGELSFDFYVPKTGLVHVNTAEPLDVVGWDPLAPVIRQRISDATATKACLLVGFKGEELRNLCEEDHELGFVIYRRLTNVVASRLINVRLAMTDAMIKQTQTNHA